MLVGGGGVFGIDAEPGRTPRRATPSIAGSLLITKLALAARMMPFNSNTSRVMSSPSGSPPNSCAFNAKLEDQADERQLERPDPLLHRPACAHLEHRPGEEAAARERLSLQMIEEVDRRR